MGLARRIWTLDDLQTVADGGLSPARRRGMADAIRARLGHPETADAREWRGRSLLELARITLEARGISLRDELDAFLRGETPGNGPTVLPMLDGLGALLRSYPRLAHELPAARELKALRAHVAQASRAQQIAEHELSIAHARITALEGQLRGTA
jgi:hypothetical protein